MKTNYVSVRSTYVSVRSADDIPSKEHWAIIRSSSVHVPAEGEWAPGHGYPAHTEQFITYDAYFVESEFLEALQRELASAFRSSVKGIHVLESYTAKTVIAVQKNV